MQIRPLRSLQAHDLDSWQALADHALEPNPFFEPDFVLPASEALAGPGTVQLLRVVDRDRTVVAFPFVEDRWRGALPATSTWRHPYCFLGTPLVHASYDPADVLRPVLTGLAERAGRRALVWEQVTADGPVLQGLRSVAEELGWRAALDVPTERAFATRRDDGAYLDHLPRKRRKEYARQRRRLAEAVGGDLLTRETTTAPDGVEGFLRLEAAGWKGEAGTALLSDPADAAMFRAICEGFAARGRLQLLELGTADRTVAVKCNLLAGEGSFAFKIGFDQTLGQYSPGVQLEIDNLQQLHRTDARWMDTCAAEDNAMINHLLPERRTLTSLVLTRDDLLGSAVAAGLRTAFRLHQRRKGTSS